MKFAVIFALAAFAIVAQANAKSVDSESLNRGALVQGIKKKLAEAKEKLNALANQAKGQLKDKIVEAQKQAEIVLEQLSEKVGDVSDKVYQAAQKVLEKADKLEDKIVEKSKELINKVTGNQSKEHVTVEDHFDD